MARRQCRRYVSAYGDSDRRSMWLDVGAATSDVSAGLMAGNFEEMSQMPELSRLTGASWQLVLGFTVTYSDTDWTYSRDCKLSSPHDRTRLRRWCERMEAMKNLEGYLTLTETKVTRIRLRCRNVGRWHVAADRATHLKPRSLPHTIHNVRPTSRS